MSSFQTRVPITFALLLSRTCRRIFGFGGRSCTFCLAHPINILHKLPIEPAQTTSHLAFLRGTFSGEGRNVPQWMVCNVTRKTY